jgi:hypothetical protein
MKIKWRDVPEDHDYQSAFDYLSLITGKDTASSIVALLRQVELSQRKAKDILRASELPLLKPENRHVEKDIKKIRSKVPLSPILLVVGDATLDIPLVIADGYHRMCAAYLFDEDLAVHCKIAELNWTQTK